MRDGPRKIARPYTVAEKDNNKTEGIAPAFSAVDFDPAQTFDLAKVIRACPPDWREWLEIYEQEPGLAGWAGFVLVAKSHFPSGWWPRTDMGKGLREGW